MNNQTDKKNLEKFDTTDIVDSCHFVCQNLTTVNILLILILCVLGFMFFEQQFSEKKLN